MKKSKNLPYVEFEVGISYNKRRFLWKILKPYYRHYRRHNQNGLCFNASTGETIVLSYTRKHTRRRVKLYCISAYHSTYKLKKVANGMSEISFGFKMYGRKLMGPEVETEDMNLLISKSIELLKRKYDISDKVMISEPECHYFIGHSLTLTFRMDTDKT